jgi:hypothetical protein
MAGVGVNVGTAVSGGVVGLESGGAVGGIPSAAGWQEDSRRMAAASNIEISVRFIWLDIEILLSIGPSRLAYRSGHH